MTGTGTAAARLSVLVLADYGRGHTGNLREHVAAFRRYSKHRVYIYNPRDVDRSRYLELDDFDVVVIHYSLVITADSYLSPLLRERIRAFRGLKIQFLQDEYRWVDEITAMMRHLEIDVLFTIVPMREIPKIYGQRLPDTKIFPTLAGFVSDELVRRKPTPFASRPIEIGYRGRVLPFWNGELSQEKVWIGKGVLSRASQFGLVTDIAWGENDRIYGERWNRFLESCRTTLATESGTSITDFDGSIERETLEYLQQHPGATWQETLRDVLAAYEGNVMMNVMSPRVLEAAALRTALVCFPGEFQNAIHPWTHYVPLAKDFSNFGEVVDAVRDIPALEQMAERTYADIVTSGRYSLRRAILEFDDVVDEHGRRLNSGPPRPFRLALAHASRSATAKTLLGQGSGEAGRRVAEFVATTRLLATEPALRHIVRAYASLPRSARRKVPPSRLAKDIVRLGLIRRSHAGKPLTAEVFSIRPRSDPDALVLTSSASRTRHKSADGIPVAADRLGHATLLWDHRDVSARFTYRLLPGKFVAFAVGYYGVIGMHHFGALDEIARHDHDAVWAGIAPLFDPPKALPRFGRVERAILQRLPRRVAVAVIRSRRDRPGQRGPAVLAVLFYPRNYAGKVYLAGKAMVSRPPLARLAWAALRDPGVRGDVGLAGILEDVVKLYAVHSARAGEVESIARVEARRDTDGTLLLISNDERMNEALTWESIAGEPLPPRVVWDNSRASHSLRFPVFFHRRLSLSLEPDGRHTFETLPALLARRPAVAWRALLDERRESHLARLIHAARNDRPASE